MCDDGAPELGFFDPFLRVLPGKDDLQSLPVFSAATWPCQAALNGTKALASARRQREEWTTHWTLLQKRCATMRRHRMDEFFHAQALVMTRAFKMRASEDSKDEPVMAPVADMLNRDARGNPQILWDNLNMSERGFRLSNEALLAAGDELFQSYGERDNLDSYVHYGFFFEDQAMEAVPLELWPCPAALAGSAAGLAPSMVELALNATLLEQLPGANLIFLGAIASVIPP